MLNMEDENKINKKQPRISQSKLISEFEARYKDAFYYLPELKSWAIYNGQKWELDAYNLLFEKMFNTLCEVYTSGTSNDYLLIRRSITILERIKKYHKSANIFDKHPELFNCLNGIYNLDTGEFIEHNEKTKELYLTKISNVNYNPSAKCERFIKFIEEIFSNYNHNKSIVSYFKKSLGYLISGYTNRQSFYFFHGEGANGKTTLIEALKSVVGEYSITFSKNILTNKNSVITGEIYKELKGRRFINVNEFVGTDRINENILKQLTGNDTLRIEIANNMVLEDRLPSKFIGITNNLPKAADGGHSLFRRMQLVVFKKIFTELEIDRDLIFKLQQEKDGIFNWLVEGYQEYKQDGKIKFPMELSKESILLRTDLVGVKHSKAMDLIYINENFLLGPATLSHYMKEMYSPYGFNQKLPSSEYDAKNLGMMLKKLSTETIISGNFKLYSGIGLIRKYTENILEYSTSIKLHLSNSGEVAVSDTHIDTYILYCKGRISDEYKEAPRMRILLKELEDYKEKLISENLYMPIDKIIKGEMG